MISLSDLNAIARAAEGVPVWGVFRNGPAAEAGVQSGDVILSCNGQRTKTIDDYVAAMKHDTAGSRHILLLRDGAELELVLHVGEEPAITMEQAVEEIARENMIPTGPKKPPRSA